MSFPRRTATVGLLAFAMACEPGVHADADVSVLNSPLTPTYSVSNQITHMSVGIPVQVRNNGADEVGVRSCSWVVEEMKNDKWHRVYTPPCSNPDATPDYLSTGQSRSLTLSVSGNIAKGNQDWQGTAGGGTYRVRLWVSNKSSQLSEYPQLVSNTFAINPNQ